MASYSIALAQTNESEKNERSEILSDKMRTSCTQLVSSSKETKTNADKEQKRKAKLIEEKKWESIGYCRITTYCPSCNSPSGSYQSSSGQTLYEGCVACSWLSIGTVIRINGAQYVVVDKCGTDAIDIFVDTPYCMCNANYYAEVEIKKK